MFEKTYGLGLKLCVLSWCRAGAMTAQGEDEKEGFVEEGHLDSGQEGEDDGAEGYFVPECRIVVPPPSHG